MIQVHTGGLQTVISLLIPGVTSILQTYSISSEASMIEFFKTLIICLNWLSRWYRFIQAGSKQLSPCLSRVSHSYRCVANSYPPAYIGFHGLRLVSISLWLGCHQSHHVLYNTIYTKVSVLYTSLLDVG